MIDRMILEVMNPAYDNINIIDAMIDAKWSVIAYINQAFAAKNWKLDPKEFQNAIQLLKKYQSNGQSGTFPSLQVMAPSSDIVKFNIGFSQKTSLINNSIKFDIQYPNKKKKTGIVSPIRLLSTEKFAQTFVEKFISVYKTNGKESELDPKTLGFNHSKDDKWMRFNKLFDGIELRIERDRDYISMMISINEEEKKSKTFKYLNYAGEVEDSDDGYIYYDILDEITSISEDSASSRNYSKIEKLESLVRYDRSNIEKLFYHPEQKENFIKLVNMMFSEKVFNRYFLESLSKINASSFDVFFNKDYQCVRIDFHGSSRAPKNMPDINRIRLEVLKKIIKDVKKYGTEYKSKHECGVFRLRRVLTKCVLLLDKINGSEDFKNMEFLIKQL